jgi:cytoskeletal protein CcmA (bactofilin family)
MLFKSAGNKAKSESARSDRAAPSILGADLKVTGDIVSDGEVHVSGAVKGDITAKKITISQSGSVLGSVEAEIASIAGSLNGRLTAATVTLSHTARVAADITHAALTIEQGAVFEGYSRRAGTVTEAEATLAIPAPNPRAAAVVMPIAGSKAGVAPEDDNPFTMPQADAAAVS